MLVFVMLLGDGAEVKVILSAWGQLQVLCDILRTTDFKS